MRNSTPRVTPSDLGDHPELAVLEILDHALGIAKFAILAEHLELTDPDPAKPPDLVVLAAEHVLITVDTLSRVIASYRGVIQAGHRWAQPAARSDHDDLF